MSAAAAKSKSVPFPTVSPISSVGSDDEMETSLLLEISHSFLNDDLEVTNVTSQYVHFYLFIYLFIFTYLLTLLQIW
jgi:hypothetical protein